MLKLEQYCAASGFPISQIELPPSKLLRLQYRYDKPKVRKLKYLLNFVIPGSLVESIIGSIFAERFGDEQAFSSEFYMQPVQWKELARTSCLGTHSYTHQPLAELETLDLITDLHKSIMAIELHTGVTVDAVSYPYGGPGAVSLRVEEAGQAVGLCVGFTMERAFNRTLERPLLLARADTNDVLAGKKAQFQYKKGEFVVTTGKFGLSRQQYISEQGGSFHE